MMHNLEDLIKRHIVVQWVKLQPMMLASCVNERQFMSLLLHF